MTAAVYFDSDAGTMISFLIDNLDHIEGYKDKSDQIDRAIDMLFPTQNPKEITLDVPNELRETAVYVLRDFARHAKETAEMHRMMLGDGESVPCTPGGCERAAAACLAAAGQLLSLGAPEPALAPAPESLTFERVQAVLRSDPRTTLAAEDDAMVHRIIAAVDDALVHRIIAAVVG